MHNKKLLIVTVNNNETEALKGLQNKGLYFRILDQPSGSDIDTNNYNIASFNNYDIVHFQQIDAQGSDESRRVISAAIITHQPDAVILLGIAWGKGKPQEIGDVLISDSIVDANQGVVKNGTLTVNSDCVFQAGNKLLNGIKRYRNNWGKFNSASIHIEPIVSSNLYSADPMKKKELLSSHPYSIGGEMEGAGAARACRDKDIHEYIVIKAISDWGDGVQLESVEDNNRNQKIAAKNAADFLFFLLHENAFSNLSSNAKKPTFLIDIPSISLLEESSQSEGTLTESHHIENYNNVSKLNDYLLQTDEYFNNEIKVGDNHFNHESYYLALKHYLSAATEIVSERFHISVRQKVCSILFADIDDDGEDEILFGTQGNMLFVYKQTDNSKPLAQFETKGWVIGLDFIDINNDGKKELLVVSDKIYLLLLNTSKNSFIPVKGNGLEIPADARSVAVYEDTTGKNDSFIAIGHRTGVTCYDFNLIKSPVITTNGIVVDIVVGDFNGNGQILIAAASEDRTLYIVDRYSQNTQRLPLEHWIISLDVCNCTDKTELYVGEFQRHIHIYNSDKKELYNTKNSAMGVFELKVIRLIKECDIHLLVIGSSDRPLYILDDEGILIWSFVAGVGQRVISTKNIDNGNFEMLVGTESGEVFLYDVCIVPNLLSKIQKSYDELKIEDLMDIRLSKEKISILRSLISYNPIKKDASLNFIKNCVLQNEPEKAVIPLMEVWFNCCEILMEYETKGRIYDISIMNQEGSEDSAIYVASEDGYVYCVDNGIVNSIFVSNENNAEIRSVCSECGIVAIASADKHLYLLNRSKNTTIPIFNHDDSLLFTHVCEKSDGSKIILVGTENKMVIALSESGKKLWTYPTKGRVRAITSYVRSNKTYAVVGSDDKFVYILDCSAEQIREIDRCVKKIETPHYVLAVKVFCLFNDNDYNFITGNEDGNIYVYDFDGNQIWRYKTGGWVAALDVYKNATTGEIEIILGSQDNHIYSLNKFGALLWQYEAAARVRTLRADATNNRIIFGSYDKKFYILRSQNRIEIEKMIWDLSSKIDKQKRNSYKNSKRRHEIAYYYFSTENRFELRDDIQHDYDIVPAVIGRKIVEKFNLDSEENNNLINLLLKSSKRVSSLVLQKVRMDFVDNKMKKLTIYKIIKRLIITTDDVAVKIDAFRQWISITQSAHDILMMAKRLYTNVDAAENIANVLLDELMYALYMTKMHSKGEDDEIAIYNYVEDIVQSIVAKLSPKNNKNHKCFCEIFTTYGQ